MGKAFGICICRLVVWVFSMCPSYDFLLLLLLLVFDNNDDDDDDDDYYYYYYYLFIIIIFSFYYCCSNYGKSVSVVVLSCNCYLLSCN